ncbi:hypothetical protein ACJX0J_038081 [Zea mays]
MKKNISDRSIRKYIYYMIIITDIVWKQTQQKMTQLINYGNYDLSSVPILSLSRADQLVVLMQHVLMSQVDQLSVVVSAATSDAGANTAARRDMDTEDLAPLPLD